MVDAPFLPEGSTHVPLIAHLSYQRHRPSRQNNVLFSKSLKTKCINDSREDTLTWQKCQNDINVALRHHEALDTLDDIRDLIGEHLICVSRHWTGSGQMESLQRGTCAERLQTC